MFSRYLVNLQPACRTRPERTGRYTTRPRLHPAPRSVAVAVTVAIAPQRPVVVVLASPPVVVPVQTVPVTRAERRGTAAQQVLSPYFLPFAVLALTAPLPGAGV